MMRRIKNYAGCLVVSALLSAHATGATFTVTSIGDGAGTCPSASNCTLRQAITDANAAGGTNIIDFAIPGGGVHTITLASQLPGITGTLTINGHTQPGAQYNTNAPDVGGLNAVPQIELVGTGGIYGLWIANANVTLAVRDLAMHGFLAAIAGDPNFEGTGLLIVYGNYLCSSVDGSGPAAGPNTGTGVISGKTAAFIGGDQPLQRNLISGCSGNGVSAAGQSVVRGNLIGTDASGTQALPNGQNGVYIATEGHNTHIGGSTAAERNVISGNLGNGINFGGYAGQADQYTGLEIKGNYIGTDWSGTQRLPNGSNPQYNAGIYFAAIGSGSDSRAAIIGGFNAGEPNLIAYNNGAGIGVFDGGTLAYSFATRGNAIFGNHGVKRANIDIGAFGPTPNDVDDADGGANYGQNFPEIIAANQVGDQLSVTYRVDSAPANAAYPLSVDFYANAHGGTGLYLAGDVYPQVSAQLQRSVTLTVPGGAAAIPLVAIATDAGFHSSEISPAFDVIFADDFE
jgi:hypothetical protein